MSAFRRLVCSVSVLTAPLAMDASAAEPKRPVQLTPDELVWRSFPAVPPGAQVSVVHGDLKKQGAYLFRVKFPPHYRVPPHSIPDERLITVLSGTLYRGIGGEFDERKLDALPAGRFVVHTPDEKVFVATKDQEVVLQVHGRRPMTPLTYVIPADDPRSRK